MQKYWVLHTKSTEVQHLNDDTFNDLQSSIAISCLEFEYAGKYPRHLLSMAINRYSLPSLPMESQE